MSEGFRLELMGTFRLAGPDGAEIKIRSKKNKALAAILALSPRCTTTRERLGNILWGSHGEEQARASVRQSLTSLRAELGPFWEELIQEGGANLTLKLTKLSVDVLDVLNHDNQTSQEKLRDLVGIAKGELLADVRLAEGEFEDWLAFERSRIHSSTIALLEKVTAQESGTKQIEAARELVRFDPLRETSHRILMRACMDCGDASLALKQYEECRTLLKRELQVEPSPETRALRSFTCRTSEPKSTSECRGQFSAKPGTWRRYLHCGLAVHRPRIRFRALFSG